MKQALADTPNETFPDATDNGKVGGPDGTWGTGAQKTWTRKQQTTVTPRTEENTQQTTPDQTEESQNSGQGSGDGGNAGNTPSLLAAAIPTEAIPEAKPATTALAVAPTAIRSSHSR